MKELLIALSKFKEECPSFVKNTDGYGYKYTPLPEIDKAITPLLKKNGLILLQSNIHADGMIGVESTVTHIETGQHRDSSILFPVEKLKGMTTYQSIGSAISYFRRYDASTLLGLQSEKDNDGADKQPAKKKTPAKKTPTKRVRVEIGTNKFDILVKWLQGGGDIQKIKDKYDVSNEVVEELKKQSLVKKPETKEGEVANG